MRLFKLWTALVLLLGISKVVFSYNAKSPHYSHMNVLDFGRGIKFISDPARRAEAYDWFAAHVDLAEGNNSTNITALKSRNSTMKIFNYRLDATQCQHTGCGGSIPNREAKGVPEAYYLHFSEDSRIRYKDLKGNTLSTVSITGCPLGQPVASRCRVQIYLWTDSRWVFNPADVTFRTWMGNRLLPGPAGVEGIFLDEHGDGFTNITGFGSSGSQSELLSGGGIYEYNGLRPSHLGALDTAYNSDMSNALTAYYNLFHLNKKLLTINTATYALSSGGMKQGLAAHGAHTELMFRPDYLSGDGNPSFQAYLTFANDMTGAGGVIDTMGTPGYFGPYGSTGGLYSSGKARYLVSRLAMYYIIKEPVGSPGIVYFNPTLWINSSDPVHDLDFEQEWYPAFDKDIGLPTAAATVIKSGVGLCPQDTAGYKVWGRDFTHAYVVFRPIDRSSCTTFGDSTAVTVNLPSTMQLLKEDGTLGPLTSTVLLHNSEGAIFMKKRGM